MALDLLYLDRQLRAAFKAGAIQRITLRNGSRYLRPLPAVRDHAFAAELARDAAEFAIVLNHGNHRDRIEAASECLFSFLCAAYAAGVPLEHIVEDLERTFNGLEIPPGPYPR